MFVALCLHVVLGACLLSQPQRLPLREPDSIELQIIPGKVLASLPKRRDQVHRLRARRPRREAPRPPAPTPPETAKSAAAPEAGASNIGHGEGGFAPPVLAGAVPPPKLKPLDCLSSPDQLPAAQQQRCRKLAETAPITAGVATTKAKQDELDMASLRQAEIRYYKDNIRAPYPGLNCWFRGKCK